MKKGSCLTSEYMSGIYSDIDYQITRLDEFMRTAYARANILFNYSSVIEDVLSNNISTLENQINSMSFTFDSTKTTFIESFGSLDSFDKEFHVDKALSIDTNNKVLTLPEKNSTTHKVVSVVVESDSNGSAGNSIENINADIKSIIDNSQSSIFEYERMSNVYTTDNVVLVLSLKLLDVVVTNSIYIKFYTIEGIATPDISNIELSKDGVKWESVPYVIDNNSKLNDYFIRYIGYETRYVRMKFTQSIAQYVSTDFGMKNRYSIGIRSIDIKSTEFESYGEYVSIPFSTGSQLSKVTLTSDDISNMDLFFYISANNGGKWLSITPDTELNLLENDTGITFVENIKKIRVKIEMKRKISPNLNLAEQIFQYSSQGKYLLKYKAVSANVYFGNHVSYGDLKPLVVDLKPPHDVEEKFYENSLFKVLSDLLGYTGTSSTITSTSISGFVKAQGGTNALLSKALSGSIIRKELYDKKDSLYHIPLKYIPYYDGIENDLDIFIGAERLEYYPVDNFRNNKYILFPHENKYHSNMHIDLFKLKTFLQKKEVKLIATKYAELTTATGATVTTPGSTTVSNKMDIYKYDQVETVTDSTSEFDFKYNRIEIKYKPITHYGYNGKIIKFLKYRPLTKNIENILVSYIEEGDNTVYHLTSKTDITLLSDYEYLDQTIFAIELSDSAYSTKRTYKVSYYHGIDITELLLPLEETSEVNVQALNDLDTSAYINIKYKYQDQKALSNIKYYSPICNEYRIQLL